MRIKVAELQRLEAVGERPDEQALRQGLGSPPAEEVASFDAERLAIERPKPLDGEFDTLGSVSS